MVNNMARRFYLSLVYDINGYDRLDLTSKKSLKELDEIVSNFNDRNEVIEAYLGEYNIDKKKGRVCIIYEDTEVKKKELEEYDLVDDKRKEEVKNNFSYAHVIPIMYKNKRLMNIEACIMSLKHQLHQEEMIKVIMHDKKTKDGYIIKRNKRYLFETEEEKDYLYNLYDYHTAVSLFLKRIKKSNPDDQYFYCRSLMDVCNLSIGVKKKVTNLYINEKNIKKLKKFEISEIDILEEESNDMDSFYTYHDLDEVIRLSPDSNRPIGSERKKIK